MLQDIQSLKELYKAIWREQNRAWMHNHGRNKPSNIAAQTYRYVSSQPPFCNTFDEKQLEVRLPSEHSMAGDFGRMYLPMPPISNAADFVPMLWFGYDLRTEPFDLRLRITMLRYDGTNLEGLPFRMERGSGRHSFFHAQLSNNDFNAMPAWFPPRQPSFPLPAKCAMTLTLCLLLTLYGLTETSRILVDHTVYRWQHHIDSLKPWVAIN